MQLIEVVDILVDNVLFSIQKGGDTILLWVTGTVFLTISRARDELGYSPKFNLEDGVSDYVEMMRRLGIKPTYLP